ADIGQRHAGVIDELALDQRVDVPLVAELLADRDRNARTLADRRVRIHPLAANQIFAEVWMQRLERRGWVDRVGRVDLRVEVDRPTAVAGSLVQQHAVRMHLAYELETIHFALARIVGSMPIGAEN